MCFWIFRRKPKPPDPGPNPPPSVPVPYEREVPSPRDIIEAGAIQKNLRQKAINIHLPFAAESVSVHQIADTNSMDGLMDYGHHILVTSDPDEIAAVQVGDVITFYREKGTSRERLICHQIVKEATDDQGLYLTTKGIRNLTTDPEKHRPEDIVGVGFALVW
jgi:hypothetical protein